jgi:hypothetical protein
MPMLTSITALLAAVALWQPAAAPTADVRVTQRALRVVCVNGQPPGTARSWRFEAAPVTLAFTMANTPRSGTASVPAGTAVVTFTPEPGHRYEVEVRASASSYSARVWPKGEWAPVVRDRTTDAIVSTSPSWADTPCAGSPLR